MSGRPVTEEIDPLLAKFTREKEELLSTTTSYLRDNPAPLSVNRDDVVSDHRRKAIDLLVRARSHILGQDAAGSSEKFSEALKALEVARDARMGVMIQEKDGVYIRDARGADGTKELGPEGFEMQHLNLIRAACDVVDTDTKLSEETKATLKFQLLEKSIDYMNKSSDRARKTQEELKELHKKDEEDLLATLRKGGISKAATKLNVAKDYQNFNDAHHNIATISRITSTDGVSHDVVEAEAAFKGLTKEQKKEYAQIIDDAVPATEKPKWFQALDDQEKALCKKYAPQIIAGNHQIPTQLRRISGMKNAFEKITAVKEGDELTVLHTSKHAGTLASLSKDKAERARITQDNARQAQSWLEGDTRLHVNVLNSEKTGNKADAEIVKSTKKAIKAVGEGGKCSVTPFNLFRLVPGNTQLEGAKELLTNLSEAIQPNGDKDLEYLKKQLTGKGTDYKKVRDIISNNPNLDEHFREPLRRAFELKSSIDKEPGKLSLTSLSTAVEIRKFFKKLLTRDSENNNLQISTRLNLLSHSLKGLEQGRGLDITKLPHDETLTMCASGKDRTGLAEHDQTAQVLSKHLGVEITEVDRSLIRAGHTGMIPGSVVSGGATIGCFGTKSENKAGLPKSRFKTLLGIVEKTSSTNKVKAKDKEVIKDKEIKEVKKKKSIFNLFSKEKKTDIIEKTTLNPMATPPVGKAIGETKSAAR